MVTTAPAAGIPSKRMLLTASCVGTSIEWYDYYIVNNAAALVFGTLFFPRFSATAATLAAFSASAIGFAARPIGGAIIGHFGDRIGRKSMLVITLLFTGLSTFLVGFLPGYAAIGVAAPALLVLLRLIQGIAVGGEWGGAVLVAAEHAPARERATFASFAQFGVPVGVLTSNLAFLAVAGLSDSAFRAWGWRIPFVLSILLVIVGYYVRRAVVETPEFRAVKTQRKVSRVPLGDLLRQRPLTLVLASLASIAPPAVGYTVIVYMLNYGTTVAGFSRSTMLTLILLSTVLWIVAIYFAAVVSDRIGAKRVYVFGAITAVLWSFPLFLLVDTRNAFLALVAFVGAALVQAIMSGAQGGLFTRCFPASMRYSGMSIAYQIGGMIGGAITPIVATALFGAYHSSTAIAVYLTAVSLVSVIAAAALRVTARPDVPAEADAQAEAA